MADGSPVIQGDIGISNNRTKTSTWLRSDAPATGSGTALYLHSSQMAGVHILPPRTVNEFALTVTRVTVYMERRTHHFRLQEYGEPALRGWVRECGVTGRSEWSDKAGKPLELALKSMRWVMTELVCTRPVNHVGVAPLPMMHRSSRPACADE